MQYVFRSSLTFATICLLLQGTNAIAACDSYESEASQSFVIATDISSSMDQEQIDLQSEAYVNALSDPEVIDKLLGCGCTELSILFFGRQTHTMIRDLKITGLEDINKIKALYEAYINSGLPHIALGDRGNTYLAQIMEVSIDHLTRSELTSFNRGILISGDGSDTSERRADSDHFTHLRQEAEYQGIQISGVSINEIVFDDVVAAESPTGNVVIPYAQSNDVNQTTNPVTVYYQENVVTEYGRVYEASSFKDFEPALVNALKEMTCKPLS